MNTDRLHHPADTAALTVTRIGHASQLIEIDDLRILTDPWFTQTVTYYHGEPVAASVESLGRIDAVVVTHEHYDHCDLPALVAGGFDLTTPLAGPGTVTAIAAHQGFADARMIEAWESTSVGELTITATPGKHGVHEVTFVLQAKGARSSSAATRCGCRSSTRFPTGSATSTWRSSPPTACAYVR